MIFSIMSWNMCIESRAETGDTYQFTGDWTVPSVFSTNTEGFGSGQIDWRLESNLDFWIVGHTYHVSGSCLTTFGSMSNISTNHSRVLWYWPGEDGDIFLCSTGQSHYANFDFTFVYYGQNLGPIYKASIVNYTPGQIGYAAPIFVIPSDAPIIFTDLGVVSKDSDILKQIDKSTQHTEQIMGEVNETSKGIFASIKDFFGSFFQNLIDSVIGLFVPSSDEMSDLFGQLNDFFSDTFGFLYAPFDYLIQLIGVFTSSTGTTGLTLPGFSIMGHEVWGDQTYDISSDPVAGQVLGYVRIGTGVLLAGWFIMYLQDFFKERFGKG